MAILINSDGTVATAFAIGGGQVLNNDAVEGLQVTSDGSTLATLQGADPSANADFVTLDYFNTNAPTPTDATSTLKLTADFNSAATIDSTATYALNAIAFRVIVQVNTVFDGGNSDATISVGWADGTGTRSEILPATVVDLYNADTYIVDVIIENATGGVSAIGIAYTVDTGIAATQGSADVYVEVVSAPKV